MMALEKYGPLIMKNIAIMGAMVYHHSFSRRLPPRKSVA